MKETNMEHYRGEIEKVRHDFALINGKVEKCKGCVKCEFKTEPGEAWESCTIRKTRWLMSEYKPEPVLTAREKGFVECIVGGWITRNKNGVLWWSDIEPQRQEEKEIWLIDFEGENAVLNRGYFPFITWEDEEPWAVADLRKLEVK